MTQFVNLTGHDITELVTNTVIPQSGTIARLTMNTVQIDTINGIPVFDVTMDMVYGIPEPQPNTVYIVSALCLDLMKQAGYIRPDVVSPAKIQRNKDTKQILGCIGFRK